MTWKPKSTSQWLRVVAVAGFVLALGVVAYQVLALNTTWEEIDRVTLESAPDDSGTREDPETTSPTASFDPANSTLPAPSTRDESTTTSTGPISTTMPTPKAPATASTAVDADIRILGDSPSPPSVVALVGSDSRSGLSDRSEFGDFPGSRADVIVLALLDEGTFTLVSIPRDLYVEDTCRGGHHRISEALSDCGDTPALANLVAELEDVVGIPIDHAVSVDLAGFPHVVDSLGGYEICTDHPLRDDESGLSLDAGCTVADGETTLRWLRSRHTEMLRDGSWEPVPSVSDLTRNDRQQQFLVDVLERQTERSGPSAILEAARDIAPYLTIDDELALSDIAAWAWDLKDVTVTTETIPATGETTARGAAVLVPSVDIPEFVGDLRS